MTSMNLDAFLMTDWVRLSSYGTQLEFINWQRAEVYAEMRERGGLDHVPRHDLPGVATLVLAASVAVAVRDHFLSMRPEPQPRPDLLNAARLVLALRQQVVGGSWHLVDNEVARSALEALAAAVASPKRVT